MPKTEFALFTLPTCDYVLSIVEDGDRVPDDLFLKAILEFDPPLLGEADMAVLLKEIDPKAEKRGRKAISAKSPAEIANTLRSVRRDDVPREFLDSLITRLEGGSGVTEFELALASQKTHDKRLAGMLATAIYDQVRELIEPDAKEVAHPILGTFPIENPNAPLRDKALTITAMALRNINRGGRVSNDRLKNIISEYRTGKR